VDGVRPEKHWLEDLLALEDTIKHTIANLWSDAPANLGPTILEH
jgi:hypothetical protein